MTQEEMNMIADLVVRKIGETYDIDTKSEAQYKHWDRMAKKDMEKCERYNYMERVYNVIEKLEALVHEKESI